MTFEQMIDIYIDSFREQSTEPGQGLVNRNRITLLENLKATLRDKVMSVDTLEAAIKEAEFETENGTPVVAIADLYYELKEVGIKCK